MPDLTNVAMLARVREKPWLFLALVSGGGLSCGGDDEGTEQPPCDIRAEACQRGIFSATASERQQEAAEMPALRTATPEQLEAELRAQLVRDSASVDYWSPALQAVGLLPQTTGGTSSALDEALIDTFLANVAAYYDPRARRITVIDRGVPSDALDSNLVLSHEYVHALQDLDVGLEAFWARWVRSTDSTAATNSLLEGEATVLGTIVLAESLGRTG